MTLIRFVVLGSAIAAAGCATNGAQMAEKHSVFKTYASLKSERDTAICIQAAVPGTTSEVTADGIVVSSKNQFGTNLVAWYIHQTASGSMIEVRRAQKIAPGIKRAESCFGS